MPCDVRYSPCPVPLHPAVVTATKIGCTGGDGGAGRGDGSGMGSRPPGASMSTESVTPIPTQAAAPEVVERTVTATSAEGVPGTASREPRPCEPEPVVVGPSTWVPKVGGSFSSRVNNRTESSAPLSPACASTPERTPSASMARDMTLRADRGDAAERVPGQGPRWGTMHTTAPVAVGITAVVVALPRLVVALPRLRKGS